MELIPVWADLLLLLVEVLVVIGTAELDFIKMDCPAVLAEVEVATPIHLYPDTLRQGTKDRLAVQQLAAGQVKLAAAVVGQVA
jgi:hypothetical protein